jgi:hypothetical protein
MKKNRDSKERTAAERNAEVERQNTYNFMVRHGASTKAKERFRRPPYAGYFTKEEN